MELPKECINYVYLYMSDHRIEISKCIVLFFLLAGVQRPIYTQKRRIKLCAFDGQTVCVLNARKSCLNRALELAAIVLKQCQKCYLITLLIVISVRRIWPVRRAGVHFAVSNCG